MGMLHVLPDRKQTPVQKGENLLSALRRIQGLRFESPCSGNGTCGKCRVICREGHWPEVSLTEQARLSEDDIKARIRLACCIRIPDEDGDYTIELPEKEEKAVVLADASYEHRVKAPLFCEDGSGYGIAVDIGTTTVAAVLLDLADGNTLERTSAVNPQTAVGSDVLSRIVYTQDHEDGLAYCQQLIVDELNTMTREMVEKAGISYKDVKGYTVAANCTMLHLLLGVDPISLGRAPFTPVFRSGQMKKAGDIGLCPENPEAGLYCLPSVSAYIGADITAGIYMAKLAETDKNVMFIDIGTNGEIVLSKGGDLYACSCAAGPAMEGMNISCGCRAAEGAIESVRYENGVLHLGVIGDTEPKGICGSGVLETVAALLDSKAIRPDGRVMTKGSLIPDALYVNGRDKGYYLDDRKQIRFSQADVRQIQLAKGAILSGFRALINCSGLTFDELDQVLIAGQFGSHLKAETMVDIGILPSETRDKVAYIGNTSLSGAISVFLDKHLVEVYENISQKVDYMELGTLKGYSELFMSCLNFPE